MANIERRTLLYAAWAAPVIALAVATPAAAASVVAGITVFWSRTETSYQLTYTNNTGADLAPGDALVYVDNSEFISNFNYNEGPWLAVEGETGQFINAATLTNGESSVVFLSITIVDDHFHASIGAYGGDFFDSADLSINTP